MKLAGAYINDDTYGRLVSLAMANNRTLAGQCRHLFDQALSGALQVPVFSPVPDITAAAPTAPAAEGTVKALPQSAGAMKEAAAQQAHAAGPLCAAGALHARGSHPVALPGAVERALSALNPEAFPDGAEAGAARALPAARTVPVAGAGVGMVVPVGTGDVTTPCTPATGLPPPAPCAGGCGHGAECGGRISTRSLMMNPPNTTTTPRPGRCRPSARTAPAAETTLHAHAASHSQATPHGDSSPHDGPALETPHAARGEAR